MTQWMWCNSWKCCLFLIECIYCIYQNIRMHEWMTWLIWYDFLQNHVENLKDKCTKTGFAVKVAGVGKMYRPDCYQKLQMITQPISVNDWGRHIWASLAKKKTCSWTLLVCSFFSYSQIADFSWFFRNPIFHFQCYKIEKHRHIRFHELEIEMVWSHRLCLFALAWNKSELVKKLFFVGCCAASFDSAALRDWKTFNGTVHPKNKIQ